MLDAKLDIPQNNPDEENAIPEQIIAKQATEISEPDLGKSLHACLVHPEQPDEMQHCEHPSDKNNILTVQQPFTMT